ncbi:SDR family oxidoreductase [Streptomyces virginiae]|uniref:SDR family oxidoreductase n=1 Tax=Streptomyces virginiae TaxID=1961 RepID=UPI003653F6D7
MLTGATGFLGSHLLLELLSTADRVTVLVRDDPHAALHRLGRALAGAGAGRELLGALRVRVLPVQVELQAPRLGLSKHAHRQLAYGVRQIWHSAALTAMTADADTLLEVNLHGTQRILELADAAPAARLFHVSTAYVCGARSGTVAEDGLAETDRFRNAYEASKYRAERHVRGWSARTGRTATVFRPSVLVSRRPRRPRGPRHPLSVLAAGLRLWAEQTDLPAAVRIVGSPHATANLLPVEYAARAMAEVGALPPGRPLESYHVVHPHETPLPVVLEAMERSCPGLSLSLASSPARLGPADRAFAALTAGFHHYGGMEARFDRTRLDSMTAGIEPPPPISADYVQRALALEPPPPGPISPKGLTP